jgi:transcriptional regulator with XRE-family HTH domain
MIDIGKKLKELRQKKNLSQRELCRLAGLTPSHVEGIEAGRSRNPRIDTVLKLANALKVPAGKLYE